jgi:hypothetical protein
MTIIRYCILAFLVMVLLSVVFQRLTTQRLTTGQALLFEPPKSWNEVFRKTLVDQSWDMTSATGWTMPGATGDPNGVRLWLEGRFASSVTGVKMMVLDQDNWQKFQAGYPPLESCMAVQDQNFRLPASTAGYYFGFLPPVTPGSGGIPTSSAGVAVRLLQLYGQMHPAPIRMTAHVELVVESFSTPSQLETERRGIAAAKR